MLTFILNYTIIDAFLYEISLLHLIKVAPLMP